MNKTDQARQQLRYLKRQSRLLKVALLGMLALNIGSGLALWLLFNHARYLFN